MALAQICGTCIAKDRSKSEILYLCLNIPKNWGRRIPKHDTERDTKHDTALEQAFRGTLVAGRENEYPPRACSRLNIILLSQNRLQMIIQGSLFEQRGGSRHLCGIGTLSFSPLWRFWPLIILSQLWFFNLQKGIFYQIWTIFQSWGLGIWPRNCKKIQMPHLGCCKWK